ncbi:unnamed protein product [Parascedosporium putredinis]|uniref:HCP-like protein n=1 Tax=Parascedosporium putredinis TaxID=1442378 RepID=A0A9P1MCG4_9PEZI|nr:unnamed protein product [Parascedosporium putredinis]CAI7998360.1 unnamed protein product [Parascedosporium putredinis]
MSRLPPLTTESPLVVQARSDYFRSMSQDSATSDQSSQSENISDAFGLRTEVQDAFSEDKRPVSMHPRMSRIPPTPCNDIPVPSLDRQTSRGLDIGDTDTGLSAFGAQRVESPAPMESPLEERFSASPVRPDEGVGTSPSLRGDTFDGGEDKTGSSYIYSKFTIPKNKAAERLSISTLQKQEYFTWDQPAAQRTNVSGTIPGAPPSPPIRSSSPSGKGDTGAYGTRGPSLDQPTTVGPAPQPIPSASEMTAEEHLAKGIECHENGSLNESTYHLRLAAKQSHPTAMLLYALACRHGWGMKKNEKEGIQWLRKAAESASLEIADDEGQAKEGKHVDVLERRTRKAQFALSIYELGMCHMNGWGIEQDRALALRCFEIAGTWGDVDALQEAARCYAEGIGCKKDLKKSAKFYRMAEAKGVNLVGNSWIHKAKYNDEEDKDSKAETKSLKARSKSRTRTLFRLKSTS